MPHQKLKKKARELGFTDENTMMVALLSIHKTPVKVSRVIDVYPNTVYNWMQNHPDKVPSNATK
jgi:hypothetical protein